MGGRIWLELAVVAVVLVWAGNFSVAKGAFAVLPPIGFTYVRYLLASTLLLLMLRASDRDWLKLTRRDWLLATVAGAVGVGLHQPLWITGLSLSTATDSSILSSTSPLFVLIIAWLRGTDRPGLLSVGGTLLSCAGVALVVFGGAGGAVHADAPDPLLGDVLTLIAAVGWASYVTLGEPLMKRLPALRATAWSVVLGTAVMTPLALPSALTVDWTTVPLSAWGAIVYGAGLSNVFGFVVWYRGVQLLGPVRLMAYQNATAPLAALLATLLLGERLGFAQIAGLAVVVAGILLVRWPTIRLLIRSGR